MKKVIIPLALAGVFATVAAPTPARADDDLLQCVREAIHSCDRDFGGNDEKTIAIRGWCYTIRAGICRIFDLSTK